MSTAPIALFAYMRPDHLRRAVASVLRNPGAAESHLYVFCDAAKRPEHQPLVDDVRRFVDTIRGFASVSIVHRTQNVGLAKSIISGVTNLLQSHERLIVLEDDLVLSPHFLQYMNDGLDRYAADRNVASIHGYSYPVEQPLPETFFLRGADCWGWATWRRAWEHFNPDGATLLAQLRRRNLTRAFDLGGAYPYTRMLEDQIAGRNDSWAIRWHAACFLDEMLTLYPARSLVQNIGNDDSGTHGGFGSDYDVALANEPVVVARIETVECARAVRALSGFFRRKRRIGWRIVNRLGRMAGALLGRNNPNTLRKSH